MQKELADAVMKASQLIGEAKNKMDSCPPTRNPSGKKTTSKIVVVVVSIYGMDFFVVLERPGYRVSRRRKQQKKIGKQHKLTKADAMKWFQQTFEGVILNKAY